MIEDGNPFILRALEEGQVIHEPGCEAALRWLRQAEHDLTIARGHQERGDFSDACFMAR